MEATPERKTQLVIVDTLNDKHGRTVKVGYRGGDVEIVVTPHSGHDGRMAFDAEGRARFVEAWVSAVRGAVTAAARLDGMNSVERAARDLIGIPDGL